MLPKSSFESFSISYQSLVIFHFILISESITIIYCLVDIETLVTYSLYHETKIFDRTYSI